MDYLQNFGFSGVASWKWTARHFSANTRLTYELVITSVELDSTHTSISPALNEVTSVQVPHPVCEKLIDIVLRWCIYFVEENLDFETCLLTI